jgi:hypothetical protein
VGKGAGSMAAAVNKAVGVGSDGAAAKQEVRACLVRTKHARVLLLLLLLRSCGHAATVIEP